MIIIVIKNNYDCEKDDENDCDMYCFIMSIPQDDDSDYYNFNYYDL